MKKRIYYCCDFCKKKAQRPGIILKHEKKCFYNPESKSCATCGFLGKNNKDGDRLDFCYKKNEFLYTLKTQCGGHETYEGWPNKR